MMNLRLQGPHRLFSVSLVPIRRLTPQAVTTTILDRRTIRTHTLQLRTQPRRLRTPFQPQHAQPTPPRLQILKQLLIRRRAMQHLPLARTRSRRHIQRVEPHRHGELVENAQHKLQVQKLPQRHRHVNRRHLGKLLNRHLRTRPLTMVWRKRKQQAAAHVLQAQQLRIVRCSPRRLFRQCRNFSRWTNRLSSTKVTRSGEQAPRSMRQLSRPKPPVSIGNFIQVD